MPFGKIATPFTSPLCPGDEEIREFNVASNNLTDLSEDALKEKKTKIEVNNLIKLNYLT